MTFLLNELRRQTDELSRQIEVTPSSFSQHGSIGTFLAFGSIVGRNHRSTNDLRRDVQRLSTVDGKSARKVSAEFGNGQWRGRTECPALRMRFAARSVGSDAFVVQHDRQSDANASFVVGSFGVSLTVVAVVRSSLHDEKHVGTNQRRVRSTRSNAQIIQTNHRIEATTNEPNEKILRRSAKRFSVVHRTTTDRQRRRLEQRESIRIPERIATETSERRYDGD